MAMQSVTQGTKRNENNTGENADVQNTPFLTWIQVYPDVCAVPNTTKGAYSYTLRLKSNQW